MKIIANIFFVLAFLTSIVAVKTVFTKPADPNNMARHWGYLIGSILLPVILLLIGTVLQKKANKDDK